MRLLLATKMFVWDVSLAYLLIHSALTLASPVVAPKSVVAPQTVQSLPEQKLEAPVVDPVQKVLVAPVSAVKDERLSERKSVDAKPVVPIVKERVLPEAKLEQRKDTPQVAQPVQSMQKPSEKQESVVPKSADVHQLAVIQKQVPAALQVPVVKPQEKLQSAPVIEKVSNIQQAPAVVKQQAPMIQPVQAPTISQSPLSQKSVEPQHISSVPLTPPVQQAPVVHQTPVVVQPVPVAHQPPVTHQIPLAQQSPVIQQTPGVQQSPVAQQLPVQPAIQYKSAEAVKTSEAHQVPVAAQKSYMYMPKEGLVTLDTQSVDMSYKTIENYKQGAPIKLAELILPPKPVESAPVVVKEEPVVVVELKHADLPLKSQLVESVSKVQPQVSEMKPSEVRKVELAIPVEPVRLAQVPQLSGNPLPETSKLVVEQPASPLKPEVAPLKSEVIPPTPKQPEVAVAAPEVLKPGVESQAAVAPALKPQSSNVKGGLGPLHLLAATLCNYQPEKLVADENLNLLYSQRAALRKSLFDFMSLKFTNLEKLSSRLNSGFAHLEVVPPKKSDDSQGPSHGWPVVGVCTAHDLRLMAEAAYCEAAPVAPSPAAVAGNRPQSGRSLEQSLVPAEQSSVISKLLHVNDIKDAPVIESSLAALNLTQQQLASLQQAQAASPRECRRNALRLTKSLFQHLAEDQKQQSESWPKLYAQLNEDECARKRMIDIVTALASFRGEATSIRRDNVEYAFAMDDLRSKVLESEVNTPLTFDKQFIEVEQFLQQSVKLMLANIDPQRARLTSMRYRSLMAGSSPGSADDQCIELHQRLLAKNYPTDCNPNQFGQLPDVLRMTASSLALYSIEQELSKYSAKFQDYPSAPCAPFVGAHVKQDVSECIANLVAS